jgi:hypothetical protein
MTNNELLFPSVSMIGLEFGGGIVFHGFLFLCTASKQASKHLDAVQRQVRYSMVISARDSKMAELHQYTVGSLQQVDDDQAVKLVASYDEHRR